ncbi:hypothetical protein NSERUTF1_1839 [Nocardia seriolae]|nr:hypothetical protein NSERUTF1_1839 [Nocardia seriolae]
MRAAPTGRGRDIFFECCRRVFLECCCHGGFPRPLGLTESPSPLSLKLPAKRRQSLRIIPIPVRITV